MYYVWNLCISSRRNVASKSRFIINWILHLWTGIVLFPKPCDNYIEVG